MADRDAETPWWSSTNQSQQVSNTPENEREYWELQNQQHDVYDYQQSSTSEDDADLSKKSSESDWEDLFAEFPVYEEDLVPLDDIQCEFSLAPHSDVPSPENRNVQAEYQPVRVYQQEAPVDNDSMRINEISVEARVAFEPDQASSSTQHLIQPKAKDAMSKKSCNYVHVTRDNRDDFRKIPANEECLVYTMKKLPKVQSYDQVLPSIQGYIRKEDVPDGEHARSYPNRKKQSRFACTYPDCEKQGTFTTKENCKNHIEKVHFGIEFECPHPDCSTCKHSYYKNMMKSNKHKGELMIRCGKDCKNLDDECKKNFAKYGPPFRVTKLSAEVPVCQKRPRKPLESDDTPKRYRRCRIK